MSRRSTTESTLMETVIKMKREQRSLVGARKSRNDLDVVDCSSN